MGAVAMVPQPAAKKKRLIYGVFVLLAGNFEHTKTPRNTSFLAAFYCCLAPNALTHTGIS